MSARYAPPSLFQARAVHTRSDPWIEDGAHLRVRVSSVLGFPMHPFAAWRLPEIFAAPTEPRAVSGRTAVGLPFEFQPDKPLTLLPPEQRPWAYVEVDAEGLVVILQAIGASGGRVLGERNGRPHAVGCFDIGAVRVLGNNGLARGVRAVEQPRVDDGTVDSSMDFAFGLPIEDSVWYAQAGGTSPPFEAKERIRRGATSQLGPAEVPDGPPFGSLSPDADVELVLGRLAPDHLDPWLEQAWRQDDEPPPAVRVRAQRDPDDPVTAQLPEGIDGSVEYAPADALLTASADPRIGRYSGLVTTDPLPVPEADPRPAIWLVVAQWAVRTRPGSALDRLLDHVDADELTYALEREFEGLPGVRQRWLSARGDLDGSRWRAVTLATLACAALEAPFDPPLVEPVAGASWWNPSQRGVWAQRIELPGEPSGVAAFARTQPEVVSFNRIVHVSGFPDRALGLMPQYRRPTGTSAGGSALLDSAVDGETAAGSWQVALADDVGRWGRPSDAVEGSRPPRPPPAPPGVEAVVISPGILHVRVEVPGPEDQPPGAPEVLEVALTVDGDSQPSRPAPPPTRPPTPVTWEVALGDLGVGGQADVVVEAALVTDEPPPFITGTRTVTVRDPRVAPAPRTGPELIWTSPSDRSGLAELGLQWPAANRTRYRVYLADERVLATALGLAVDPAQPRAARAARLARESSTLANKALFTLLTDEPIGPDGDGIVRFRQRLPGALRTVQFARVVPVSEHGNVEAAFVGSGLVPIAVPLSETPPPPTLSVAPHAGGVRLTIAAPGIRPDVLSMLAAEGTGLVPQVRLRRALGRVAEADTMLAESPIDLTPPASAAGSWTATIDVADAELPPFVRTLWVAEVRYPAEPALEPGTQPTPNPGGVVPLAGATLGPRALDWSAASLSASTMHVPPAPPPPPTGASATTTPTGRRITLPQLPPTHPRTTARWSLVVVRHTSSASEPLPTIDLTGKLAPMIIDDPAPADAYTLALTDPLGRVGKPVEVAVS